MKMIRFSILLFFATMQISFAASSIMVFTNKTDMTNFFIPSINNGLSGLLLGINGTNDGNGGMWTYLTNSTKTVNLTNTFAAKPPANGRWELVPGPGPGGSPSSGLVGGGLSGYLPTPNLELGSGQYVQGDLPLSNIVQIANNTLLGNFTGGTADIQVLTSITSANLAQVLSNETGTGLAVFGTDPTFAAGIVVTTGLTNSTLTATRGVFVGTGGVLTNDSDFTFATDTLIATKIVAPTSVSTPSLISTAAITATPAAGNNFNIALSGAGDFAVNTSQLYVDTSDAYVGFGTAVPQAAADIRNGNLFFTQTGLTHDVTDYLPTSVGVQLAILSLTNGGGLLRAISAKSDVEGLYLQGVSSASPTAPTIYLQALKRSGAGATALAAGETVLKVNNSGTATLTILGSGTTLINGGLAVGGATDPGSGRLRVYSTSALDGLVTATASLTYPSVTASTVAGWNVDKQLTNSAVTLAELAYLTGVTGGIQTNIANRVMLPQYGAGNPNVLGTIGQTDGQLFMDTNTGNKYNWYAANAQWQFCPFPISLLVLLWRKLKTSNLRA